MNSTSEQYLQDPNIPFSSGGKRAEEKMTFQRYLVYGFVLNKSWPLCSERNNKALLGCFNHIMLNIILSLHVLYVYIRHKNKLQKAKYLSQFVHALILTLLKINNCELH